MVKQFDLIALDADDTLWVNEPHFREAEQQFATLMEQYGDREILIDALTKSEVGNLGLYGYGIKSFTLSMLECALKVSNYTLTPEDTDQIIEIGKEMLQKPVVLIQGVVETLKKISKLAPIIVITKGDLLDQERKFEQSGLKDYIKDFRVVSNKTEETYQDIMDLYSVIPERFMMVGNSLKSDVLPPIKLGAKGVYIPFETSWSHEDISPEEEAEHHIITLDSIEQLPKVITGITAHNRVHPKYVKDPQSIDQDESSRSGYRHVSG